MKPSVFNRSAIWWMIFGLSCAVVAQEEPQDPQQQDRKGEVIDAQAGTLSQFQTQFRAGLPEGMDRGQVAEAVRERVQRFEQLRTAFLEERRKMLQELKGASSEVDRELIRERIRERRQEWTEFARQIREQARERVQALKEALPNHGELLDQAREQLRDQVREGVEAAKERARRGVE